jgi:hypothetical protein
MKPLTQTFSPVTAKSCEFANVSAPILEKITRPLFWPAVREIGGTEDQRGSIRMKEYRKREYEKERASERERV